jgi:DNA-binding SARP family transcriptional activator/TolB-like protein
MTRTVSLLGPFAAGDARGDAIQLRTRKAEALLAVLAVAPGGRQPRDRLLDLLWGARAESQARHSLSQTLSELRHFFGKDVLAAHRDAVVLTPNRLDIDVLRFLRTAQSHDVADLQQAAALYRGPLLDGLMVREAAFQEWIGTERARFNAVGVDVLTRLGKSLARDGDEGGALRAFQAALDIDRLADRAHAALMQLHLDHGRQALVARHYADCVRRYRQELDAAPGDEIERIAREAAVRQDPPRVEIARAGPRGAPLSAGGEPMHVRSGRSSAETAANSLQPRSRTLPSLVVLPFRNLSAEPSRDFVDRFVDDIALALFRLKEVRVIDRHSADIRRGRSFDVRRAGVDVGATYVMEGSVRRSGAQHRIMIRLVHAETRMLLWCERFGGDFSGRDGVQERHAHHVVSAIHGAVRAAEIAVARSKRPENQNAYDLVLQAYPLLWSQDRLKNKEAIRLLRKSIAIDGDYARAHALLAWCLAQEIVYFWSADPGRDRESALRAVDAASACIDDDPTAMAAIGAALSQCGDQEAATAWLARALWFDPNNAWAWGRYGHVALYSNDPERAKQWFKRSLEISPYDPFAFNMHMGLAQALGMEGSYHEAIAITRDVLSKHPHVTWANRTLASYQGLTGDVTSARIALEKLVAATPNLSVQAMKHTHPMRHIPRYYETLVEGLERAGLPKR